jgi:uncharacterized protein YndB with AHSA1/START domain
MPGTPYVSVINVEFQSPREQVYRALTALGSFPIWVSGMIRISHTGPMTEGLRYFTENTVAGTTSRYDLEVKQLVPNRRIVLVSEAGLISFTAEYDLDDIPEGGTLVTCQIRFRLQNFVLNLARPAIESMAKARIQADLEGLNIILAEGVLLS